MTNSNEDTINSEVGLRDGELEAVGSNSLREVIVPAPDDIPEDFREAGLVVSEGFDAFKKYSIMMASYYRVPMMSLSDYIQENGNIIEVCGCCIHPGVVFKPKSGEGLKRGEEMVLLKLTEWVKRGKDFRFQRVLNTSAKDVMDTAKILWIPALGKYDWPGSIQFYVHVGNRGRISLQDISSSG